MALIHREASEDFPEKSAGRAAFNSDLVDIVDMTGGAEMAGKVVGAVGMGGPGLQWENCWLGIAGGALGVAGSVRFGYWGYNRSGVDQGVGGLNGDVGRFTERFTLDTRSGGSRWQIDFDVRGFITAKCKGE